MNKPNTDVLRALARVFQDGTDARGEITEAADFIDSIERRLLEAEGERDYQASECALLRKERVDADTELARIKARALEIRDGKPDTKKLRQIGDLLRPYNIVEGIFIYMVADYLDSIEDLEKK
jgi:hypothetical protein